MVKKLLKNGLDQMRIAENAKMFNISLEEVTIFTWIKK